MTKSKTKLEEIIDINSEDSLKYHGLKKPDYKPIKDISPKPKKLGYEDKYPPKPYKPGYPDQYPPKTGYGDKRYNEYDYSENMDEDERKKMQRGYSDNQWKLLQKLLDARKYNLDILRGKRRMREKGSLNAKRDYEKAQEIQFALGRGEISEEEAERLLKGIDILLSKTINS